MQAIKVMIVDDSSLMRNILRKSLQSEKKIEIVAHAANGKVALMRIARATPDVIILDVEMPEMDGLQTLRELNKLNSDIKVIMFSSLTTKGAEITLEALKGGAIAFVAKPEKTVDLSAEQYIQRELIPLILNVGVIKQVKTEEVSTSVPTKVVRKKRDEKFSKCSICAIGISTGGPQALRKLLPLLEKQINGSILIVQHMPAMFTHQLAVSLNQICNLEVLEATQGQVLEKGKIYIAPGNFHMRIIQKGNQSRIDINQTEAVNNVRPSADVLFQSLAKLSDEKIAAIIMTGMGSDGYNGLCALKKSGALLAAQSKESCLIFGMPKLPTENNLVDYSGNLVELASFMNYVMSPV